MSYAEGGESAHAAGLPLIDAIYYDPFLLFEDFVGSLLNLLHYFNLQFGFVVILFLWLFSKCERLLDVSERGLCGIDSIVCGLAKRH
jgi:hypothetical protein